MNMQDLLSIVCLKLISERCRSLCPHNEHARCAVNRVLKIDLQAPKKGQSNVTEKSAVGICRMRETL